MGRIIVRDDMGGFLACLCLAHSFFSSTIIVKCWALLQARQFFVELGFYNVELEEDAQVIIQALKKENDCITWFCELIEKSKCNLRNQPQWQINFTYREGNGAAHA